MRLLALLFTVGNLANGELISIADARAFVHANGVFQAELDRTSPS